LVRTTLPNARIDPIVHRENLEWPGVSHSAWLARHGDILFAKPLARHLANRGIHYGWVMVALTFAYVICSSAVLSIPSILLTPISREFGWSIGELSGPLGLRMALFGMIAPFAGALMMRYGPRNVLTGSAVLLIAGMLLAMTMASRWQLWLSFGVILGVAPGLTALVLSATIATRWFTERRGLVLGLMGAGAATGQMIFLPPAAWLTEHYGWRMALAPSAIVVGLIAALFFIFSCDHPSDVNLPPYGEATILPPAPKPASNPVVLSFIALRTASSSMVFWVLAFTFFVCGLSSFGLTPHFVTLCGDFGVGPMIATSLLALIGICDLVGTIGSGWLSDRFDNRWLLGIYYGFRGLSLIWLPFSGFSLLGLSVFAVFYGLDFIATIPPTVRLTARTFGRDQAPLVFGWIFAAHQLGAGLMAVAVGRSRDVFASYLPGFLVAGVICVIAALSLLLLRGRMRPLAIAATPA
jgi:predicted MFS family arabinose efflux permease